MSLVSVIMPIYNTSEFLNQSIQSVLSQTYKNIELILINDGSNDESKQIIENYKQIDKRIKIHHFEKNKGVGYVRNYGIKMATGSHIYFLDSDDYLSETTLQSLFEYINKDDAILGKIETIHLTDSHIEMYQSDNKIESKEYHGNIFEKENIYSVLNCLFKKEFIVANNMSLSEDVANYSDIKFIVEFIAKKGTVSYLDSSIYFKRKRNDPITN